MGTGVCERQDNAPERYGVIEISIKEVISGVIAEVLWFVLVHKSVRGTHAHTKKDFIWK